MSFGEAFATLATEDLCTPDGCDIDHHLWHLLFVWDDLRYEGLSNFWLEDQARIGNARTLRPFELFIGDYYKVLIDRPGYSRMRYQVCGELWLVTPECIRTLDSNLYENTRRFMRYKEGVKLTGPGVYAEEYAETEQRIFNAWTYFGVNDLWNDVVPSLDRLQPSPMDNAEYLNVLQAPL